MAKSMHQGIRSKVGTAAVGVVVAWVSLFSGADARAQRDDREVSAMLADAFTREAVLTLTRGGPGDRSRLEAAAILLDFAAELAPQDAERQRIRATLAESRGDPDTRRRALAQYVQLQPADDAALLDLLLTRLLDTQTLDGRLSAIERVLNAANTNDRLSDPLRSRLALLAAQAARELGDPSKYARWLSESAKLDPANAPAAKAMYALLIERNADGKALGAAAKNWVEASPVDPRARLALASALSAQAVYLDAAQQFANAARFSGDAPLPWSAYRTWAVCVGAAGDTRIALDLLDSLEQLQQTGVFGDVAGDGGLPIELELVRLTLLDGAQPDLEERDEDAVAATYDRVVKALEDEALRQPSARLELAWIQAIYGDAPDDAEARLANAPTNDPVVRRARGWIQLRRGEDDEATWTFEQSPDDPLCKLGLAILTGLDDPGRARFFKEIIRDAPESLAALVTAQMLHRDNRPVEPTLEGRTILDLMQRSPIQVWRMDLDREPWLAIDAKVRPLDAEPFAPLTLELSIRNVGLLPIALGPGQPVRATVLVNLGMFKDGQAVGTLPTQVIDAHRRLTLAPGERITVAHRLDWRELGELDGSGLPDSFSYALSTTLDPRVRSDGAVAMGPMGTTDAVRGLRYAMPPVTPDSARSWLSDVDSNRAQVRAVALARLAMIGEGPDSGMIDPTRAAEIAGLINERSTALSPVWLAWLAYHLEASPQSAEYQRALDAARRSDHDLVRVAHLLGQADRPDHPALDAAERSALPRLKAFAPLWRDVLAGPGAASVEAAPAP